MLSVRHLSVSINKSFDEVYDFAHRPENYTKWTEGLATALHPRPDGTWYAETDQGGILMEFTPPNGFGILDHTAHLPTGILNVPMRVVRNGQGVEVIITLFRYDNQTDANFANDMMSAVRDLEKLKKVMEDDGLNVIHADFNPRGKRGT